MENMGWHDNGSEWATNSAAAAVDALLWINNTSVFFILVDSIYRAVVHARNFSLNNGVIRADLCTVAAVDAISWINASLAVYTSDSLLGAVGDARTGNAAFAS